MCELVHTKSYDIGVAIRAIFSGEGTMPTFSFHLADGSKIIDVSRGEFPDVAAAERAAKTTAANFANCGAKSLRKNSTRWTVVVLNDKGRRVLSVPLTTNGPVDRKSCLGSFQNGNNIYSSGHARRPESATD